MIICGYSSYSWIPDWKTFRRIADSVGAYLLADISHIGGLVAAGVVPSPVGYAHVITSTTHKTLRRAARRRHPDHRPGPGQKARQGRLPRRTGRAARPYLRRPGAHLQTGPHQAVRETPEADHQERPGHVRTLQGTRPAHPLRRDQLATCSTWTAAPSKVRMAPPSPATRPPASWIWPASSSTATPSPATNPPSTPPASVSARPGSPSAASTRRNPANWPISSRMCCWLPPRTASRPPRANPSGAPRWISTS